MKKKEIQRLQKEQEKMQAALDKQSKKISELGGPEIYEYHLRYLNETVAKVSEVIAMSLKLDIMLKKAAEDAYCHSLYTDLKDTEKALDSLISNLHWRDSQKEEMSNRKQFYRDLP